MKRFRDRENGSHLDDALRRERPRPPRELEELITTYVAYRPRERRLAPRLVAAVALSVATAAVLGALVGIGQAASGPQNAVQAVVNVVAASTSSSTNSDTESKDTKAAKDPKDAKAEEKDDNPAHDQYKPGQGCGDTNHVHAKENECKKLK
jgi:hypothetical protein